MVAKMVFGKMLFAKVLAVSVIVLEPPLAERLRAVATQKRAVLDALALLVPARERLD
jgi:fructose-1,6-bisphosphatase/sedoheptulose 1,7-bisphosphatase-like protein